MLRFLLLMEFFMRKPDNQQLFYTADLKFTQATHYILNYQKMNKDQIFRIEAYYKLYNRPGKNSSLEL